MVLFLALLPWFLYSPSEHKFSELLESEYKSGKFKDPIEALIFINRYNEKTYNENIDKFFALKKEIIPFICALLSFIFITLLAKALEKMHPAYNFYWGDNISVIDRMKSRNQLIWGVLGLGVVASLIAGFIMKIF